MKNKPNNYDTGFLETISIRNDLNNLIPVGTLNFYGLPNDISPLTCMVSGNGCNSEWRWLEIEQLTHICNENVSEIVMYLNFLISNIYVIATYKNIQVNFPNQKIFNFFKVRIYSIASDIEGARFINELRKNKPGYNNIQKIYTKIWPIFINMLDYSKVSWSQRSNCTLSEFLNNSILLNPCQDYSIPEIFLTFSNHHIKRWLNNEQYKPMLSNAQQESLFSRVQKIYDKINSPSFNDTNKLSEELPIHNIPGSLEKIYGLLYSDNNIDGIKTSLYPFQRKSVAKMLEKESYRMKAMLPNYIKLKSAISQTVFYFDFQSCKIILSPEIYRLPRGGILAENMGLGKTLICLSLVCITKCDFSKVPDDIMLYEEEESGIEEINPAINNITKSKKLKILKLVDLCVKKINSDSLPWKYFINYLPETLLYRLKHSPGMFKIPIEFNGELRKQKSKTSRTNNFVTDKYKKLYLCTTTLIVVPENLFHQWQNEINKHVKIGFLNSLFISKQFKKTVNTEYGICTSVLGDTNYLLEFDIILISSSIFAKCFSIATKKNTLTEIYWKRLIIDEGHSVSSKSTRVSLLCKSLYAERIWAVTGTPTSGMTKLYMDEDGSSQLAENTDSFNKKQYSITNKYNPKDDLNKLGSIFSNFLKIEPYYSQPKIWNNHYIKPLLSDTYGYEFSLLSLLNNTVIRHNLKDVKCDLQLPQLHHKPVFLRPSYHNKLSINLFTAVLAVNAISSEREDIDYMFHPSNRQRLRKLITNLQRATFHWTGFKQKDIESLIHISKLCLEKKDSNGDEYYNPHDCELLRKALKVSQIALSNARWRTMSLLHEMSYYVNDLPKVFTKYFGIGMVEQESERSNHLYISVFGAPHLHKVQEFFYKNRFMNTENDEVIRAKIESYAKPFWNTYWKDTLKRNIEKFNKQDTDQEFQTKHLRNDIMDSMDDPKILNNINLNNSIPKNITLSPVNKNIKVNNDNHNTNEELNNIGINNNSFKEDTRFSFDSMKNSKILGTASSKLSYLGSRLLDHKYQNIKSIVFFEFEDSAYYLAELLDILGLKYILYATFISPIERAKNLAEFTDYDSKDKGGICLIMDLRLSAHGLTIIAATRVYFLNPVWKKSIEAQAIKRAHRIGQQNEVYVETLILEGTLEEEIYRKRISDKSLKSGLFEASDNKFVIDDTGMQEFVLKHEFLDFDENENEFSSFISPALSTDCLVKSSNSDYSLLNHVDSIYSTNQNLYKKWTSYVFSNGNISRFNELNLKKNPEHLDDYLGHESKKRVATNISLSTSSNSIGPRKKVHF